MSERAVFTEEWLADYQARSRAHPPLVPRHPAEPAAPVTRGNKYGAIRTTAPASWGGVRLADSKSGARLMGTLATQKLAGSILDYWEEVSLPIGVDEAGKVIRYRADAMVLLGYTECGAMVVRFYDAKSKNMDTPTSKAKRAALRNRGLNVEVVDGKVEGIG